MKLTIVPQNMGRVLAMFEGVKQGMLDLRQLGTWEAVASEFRKVEKEQFATEGGAGRSGKWAALKANYARRKAAKWGNKPILQASGRLYGSLINKGSGDAVYIEKKQELTLGSATPYGIYHQTGTRHMKARPPISLTDDQEKRILEPIQRKLIQLAGNAKLRGFFR